MNQTKIIVLLAIATIISTLDNDVALIPPFIITTKELGCNINQDLLRKEIDQMSSSGLTSIGFNTLLIDDCWQGSRDSSTGKITWDINKFPSGLPTFISYANNQGISVGLGTDISLTTKSGKSGSMNFEKTDANTYASWGIQLVSISDHQNLVDSRQRFTFFSQFIQKTLKKIIISIDTKKCNGVWARDISNIWTTTDIDIVDWDSLDRVLTKQVGQQRYAGSGAWNDPGIINHNLALNEYQTQVILWMMLKAPIKLNAPLAIIEKSRLIWLMNSQILAINQDSLKQQAKLIQRQEYQTGYTEVWGGELSSNNYVYAFINGKKNAASLSVNISNRSQSYSIRDPISHKNLGSSSNNILSVENVPANSIQVRIIHF